MTDAEFEVSLVEDTEKFLTMPLGEQLLTLFILVRRLDHSTAVAVRDLAHHVHDEFSPFGSKTGLPRFVKHEDTNASSLSDSLQPESTGGTR